MDVITLEDDETNKYRKNTVRRHQIVDWKSNSFAIPIECEIDFDFSSFYTIFANVKCKMFMFMNENRLGLALLCVIFSIFRVHWNINGIALKCTPM